MATTPSRSSVDPDSGYVVCAAVTFTAGRPLPVLMTVAYSIARESFGPPGFVRGECKTRLDGADQSVVPTGDINPGFPTFPDAGVPIVDVIGVSAGTHALEFLCREHSAMDMVFGDIRLAVVELGMD